MENLKTPELTLGGLYASYGYKKYKMSRFEEYSLYLDNEDFLTSKDVITFNGRDGKLRALRPDVTLSIVKNSKASEVNTEKLYYSENVYRLAKGDTEFKEISQMGVELIGKIDMCAVAEITLIILKSLNIIGGNSILAVSEVGFVAGLIDSFDIGSSEVKEELLSLLRRKNTHDLDALTCLRKEDREKFKRLIAVGGRMESALSKAEELISNDKMKEAFLRLERLYQILKDNPLAQKMQLDFSIVNNESYYNGIIYNGYIQTSPNAVLVGGQYDKLPRKFGISAGALGFALDLGVVADGTAGRSVDYLIVYNDGDNQKAVIDLAEGLRAKGKSVRVEGSVPADLKYNKLIEFGKGGAND